MAEPVPFRHLSLHQGSGREVTLGGRPTHEPFGAALWHARDQQVPD